MNNKIKPVHYMVKLETVLPSQKHDCHPFLVDFANDEFSIPIIDKAEKIIFKPPDSFYFQTFKPFQSHYKKPIKKNTNTLLQKSAILNDIDITDNDGPIEKKRLHTDQYSICL